MQSPTASASRTAGNQSSGLTALRPSEMKGFLLSHASSLRIRRTGYVRYTIYRALLTTPSGRKTGSYSTPFWKRLVSDLTTTQDSYLPTILPGNITLSECLSGVNTMGRHYSIKKLLTRSLLGLRLTVDTRKACDGLAPDEASGNA